MKFSEIKSALKHLVKTTLCLHCQAVYELNDVSIIATTKNEGLFEMSCNKCHLSSIMTVSLSPEIEVKHSNTSPLERTHGEISGISQNDVLDVKNFLNNFDGDFKNLFPNEK